MGIHRKDENYCNECGRKLQSKEKEASTNAGFLWPICRDCVYTLAYRHISEHGFRPV